MSVEILLVAAVQLY